MIKAKLLVFLALCSCAIDDRRVGACVGPASDGLVTDFSAARARSCPAGFCATDLVGSATVSLGEGEIAGLIFPYKAPELGEIALGLFGEAASQAALLAVMDSGSLGSSAASAPDGFALEVVHCIDTSAYSGVSFTTEGDLGSCPLRFAVQFQAGDAGTFKAPCPLDECFAADSVPVATGTTTLTFAENGSTRGPTALAGMQWEFSVPSDPPGGCTADFTIDDIRLVLMR